MGAVRNLFRACAIVLMVKPLLGNIWCDALKCHQLLQMLLLWELLQFHNGAEAGRRKGKFLATSLAHSLFLKLAHLKLPNVEISGAKGVRWID